MTEQMTEAHNTSKTPRRAYVIWAHPRRDSLTARVVQGVKDELLASQVEVKELDLYRADFDPALREDDEPDWANPDKRYSEQVMRLAADLEGSDLGIVVFPLWWFTVPAMLKGYMDRVWNYGLLYGNGKSLPFKSLRWIALVGGAQKPYEGYGNHTQLTHLLKAGSSYSGVKNTQVDFLYNTIAVEEDVDDLLAHHDELIAQTRASIAQMVAELESCDTAEATVQA